MRRLPLFLALCTLILLQGFLASSRGQAGGEVKSPVPAYFPERGDWARKDAGEAGFSPRLLQEAVDFAIENESSDPKDLGLHIALGLAREPYGEIVGPTRKRGSMNGLIVHAGRILSEWGDTGRVDMTFSVTKTFLSSVVGLAWDRGLIEDIDDPVGPYLPTDHFESAHNRKITWDHLLRQTSDWQGTLWGKPDWADRPSGDDPSAWPRRELHEPGTFWKYNDVRVNLLALAALHVWRKPLPRVLKEELMDPIGASSTWRWHGYRNSWVVVDGLRMQSVSGGGHWGGGMFISSRDLARFGYLLLRHGKWRERQILSEEWIEKARLPTAANKGYGYMNWFLNRGEEQRIKSAPGSSVVHLGAGTNAIYLDWENDLVVVVRWIEGSQLDAFIGKVLAALSQNTPARESGRD